MEPKIAITNENQSNDRRILPLTSKTSLASIGSKPDFYALKEKTNNTFLLKAEKLLDTNYTQAWLASCLLLSLYIAEIWILVNVNESNDIILNSLLLIILGIFLIELGMMSLLKKGYFLHFFFWMDLLGSLSLLLDLTFVSAEIQYRGGATLFRAARMTKVWARTSRLTKLVRLFRVMNIFSQRRWSGDMDPCRVKGLSSAISLKVAHRVVTVVMILILCLPLLSQYVVDMGAAVQLHTLVLLEAQGNCSIQCFDKLVEEFNLQYVEDSDANPAELYIHGIGSWDWWDSFGTIRSENLNEITYGESYLVMNWTLHEQSAALCNVLVITLAIILLVGFNYSFLMAMDTLVIQPLNRMLNALRESTYSIMLSVSQMEDVVDKSEFKVMEGKLETELLEDLLKRMAEILKRSSPHADNRRLQQLLDDENRLAMSMKGSNATKAWLMRNFVEPEELEAQKRRTSLRWAISRPSMRKITNPPRLSQRSARISMDLGMVDSSSLSSVDASAPSRSSLRRRSTVEMMDFNDMLNTWNFNALSCSEQTLIEFLTYMYEVCEATATLKVGIEKLQSFFTVVKDNYKTTIPYHTFRHGVDVCYTTLRLINLTKSNQFFSQKNVIALMVGSLAHDIGHLGVNNGFLVTSRHKLALRYNDISPLENMHIAILYSILSNPEYDVFCNMTKEEWTESRKIIIKTILGTDMQHHFRSVNTIEGFVEVQKKQFKRFYSSNFQKVPDSMKEPEHRLMLMDMFVHAADISSPTKPPHIFQQWAELVLEEFFQQGDMEKKQKMEVSPMMDRENANLPNLQMGFIEFVVSPLYFSLCDLFPDLRPVKKNLLENFKVYAAQKRVEIQCNIKGNECFDELLSLEEKTKEFTKKCGYYFEEPSMQPESVTSAPFSPAQFLSKTLHGKPKLVSSSNSFRFPARNTIGRSSSSRMSKSKSAKEKGTRRSSSSEFSGKYLQRKITAQYSQGVPNNHNLIHVGASTSSNNSIDSQEGETV